MIPWHLYFICRHFRTLCPIFIGCVSRRNNQDEIVGVFIWEKAWLENSLSQLEGLVRVEKQAVEGKDPKWRPELVREEEMVLCQSEKGDGRDQTTVFQVTCLLSLSVCRRGFQDLLKVRPSSLFTLCWCISSSVASLMSRAMYPVLAERSFVFCSLIIWS